MRMVLCGLFALAVMSSTIHAAVETMPVDEIRRGMRGVTMTVMEGTEIVPLETELLGVQRDAFGPGYHMIIGRLVDPRTELSGAVHGMSGSPLYIDGRLVGALSRRIAFFEKDGHCGFTPIADMLDVDRRGRAGAPRSPVRNLSWMLEPWGFPGGSPEPARRPAHEWLGLPISVPDMPSELSRRLEGMWRHSGLTPVSAGRGGNRVAGRYTPADDSAMQPGAALAAVLSTGDISLAAAGTMTWREGPRFLGFGHPMFGMGRVDIPVAGADVVTVVPSFAMPFKLTNTTELVGTMDEDRLSAVGGRFGQLPAMASYEVGQYQQGGVRRVLSGEMVKDPELGPLLMAVMMMNTLLDGQEFTRESTLTYQFILQYAGLPEWKRTGTVSPDLFGRIQLLMDLVSPVAVLSGTHGRELDLKSFQFQVDVEEGDTGWMIDSVSLPSSRAERGSRVEAVVRLRNREGMVRHERATLDLPPLLKQGRVGVRAASGAWLRNQETAATINTKSPGNAREWILANQSVWKDGGLYLQLVTLEPTAAEGGRLMGMLPGTISNRLPSPARPAPYVHASHVVEFDGSASGHALATLEIEP